MKKEDCEGCLTKINTGECIWFNEDLTCPCSTCLIKMMCLTPCDLLKKHINKIHGQKGLKIHLIKRKLNKEVIHYG